MLAFQVEPDSLDQLDQLALLAHRVTKGPRVFLDCRVQQALQVQPDLKATEVWAATEEQLGIAANPDRLVPQGTRDQLVLKDRWVQLDQLGHWDHRVTKERLGRQEMLEEMPNQVSRELSELRVFQGTEVFPAQLDQLVQSANQATTDLQDQLDRLDRPETRGSLGPLVPQDLLETQATTVYLEIRGRQVTREMLVSRAILDPLVPLVPRAPKAPKVLRAFRAPLDLRVRLDQWATVAVKGIPDLLETQVPREPPVSKVLLVLRDQLAIVDPRDRVVALVFPVLLGLLATAVSQDLPEK